MRAIGGAFSPNREVDEMRWLSVDDARETVTRGVDRDVLERFAQRPAMTGSVLLVRHASAGSRAKWNGDDRLRPLDESGEEQAEELVRLLSRFEVDAILSAELRTLRRDGAPPQRVDRGRGQGGPAASATTGSTRTRRPRCS